VKQEPDLCADCHDLAALVAKKPVRHAPASEGRCLGCHDPHGSGEKAALRAAPGSSKGCLACHAAAAPRGKGTPSPAFRVDLGRKHVHDAVSGGDCGDCHVAGHGGDLPRLLKKPPADLCRDCHDKVGKERFPHSAVALGDCTACHDPHASDAAKLLARPTEREVCFVCHADDLTGRAVVHAPVEGGCSECHAPHGGPNRFGLKASGKDVCYACHKPVDAGKVKHAAIERYGCTICHDPHASASRFLVAKPVTELCATCHPGEADGRHVTTLVRAGHAVSGGADPKRPGRDFSCASCHDPHASDHPRLLRYGDSAMQSCDWCHGDKSGRNPELKDVSRRASGAPRGVTGAGGPGGPASSPSPSPAPSPEVK
jgi:predicted CXXCH cytochrome family protein